MKKLVLLSASLALLAPTFALAQDANTGIRAEANLRASTTMEKPRPPQLGPAIKNLASTTRAELRGAASTTREVIRKKLDTLHALVNERKDQMRERAEAARSKAKENFGERIEKLVGKVSDRLASSSAKLSAIAVRIGTRIDTLEAEGYDMGASSELLAIAQTDLATANDKIAAVNQALADAMAQGTTTAKAQIPVVRAAVKAAEDALKLVKEDLQKTLRSIQVEGRTETNTSTSI